MTAPRLAPRRAAVTLAAVLALHLALWVVVRAPMRRTTAAAPVRLSVRALPAPHAATGTRPHDAAAPRATARPRDGAGPAGPTNAATATATAPITLPTGAALAAVPAASAASAPERALDLALPRGAANHAGARNPALDDPRSNSARIGPEGRFAAALGSADGALVDEPLSDGRRRIRRGGTCVIATPARVSQLFPFDDSATRAPHKIEPC